LQCDEQFSGREIQCPTCHVLLHIPPIPGRTANFKMESGKTWATFIPPGDVQAPKGLSLSGRPATPKPPGK
jgi:hypothetical protein